MSSIAVVARQELRFAMRERLAAALLIVFLGMAIVSSAIGWATHHTVNQIYNEALRQTGRAIQNPFASASPLENIKNTIVYIVLIGALLAIVLGARAAIRDRKSGVVDLIFSRPIKARSYVWAKLLGTQVWIGVVLVVALLGSWIGVWVVDGKPLGAGDTASLVAFFAIAWLFLLPFTVLGLVSGARARHESSALLIPILVWVAFVFVIPQLGTAQNPSSLLNPVPSNAPTADLLFKINHAILQPISFTEHFKHAGASLLHLRDVTSTSISGDLASLVGIAALSLLGLMLVTRSAMRRPLDG